MWCGDLYRCIMIYPGEVYLFNPSCDCSFAKFFNDQKTWSPTLFGHVLIKSSQVKPHMSWVFNNIGPKELNTLKIKQPFVWEDLHSSISHHFTGSLQSFHSNSESLVLFYRLQTIGCFDPEKMTMAESTAGCGLLGLGSTILLLELRSKSAKCDFSHRLVAYG